MLLDLSPLRRYRDYRLLFIGQLISSFGSMMTYVALPYQLYHLTGSSMAVGVVGVAQLAPLLITALIGGAYADAIDRRKLMVAAEAALVLCSGALALNAMSAHPRVWIIYAIAAASSAANGFHTPALSSMTPRLVERADIPATSALNSLKSTLSSVAGPALGGILIASAGLSATYLADVLGFAASLVALWLMKPMPATGKSNAPGLSSILEGLRYARSREELIGTYAVDIVAMIFGMPMALFPAIAEGFGGARVVGWLYSAPSVGALLASLFSAWTKKVRRHGAAVIAAATVWGLAIVAFGYAPNLPAALFFLVLAGGADMVSGIFRNTIWNGTIPDHLRGRLAGVEMVSYMSGPLLGNAESGLVAAISTVRVSVVSGGALCVAGVLLCALGLPRFWSYEDRGPVEAKPG
jgi:MFS family permease